MKRGDKVKTRVLRQGSPKILRAWVETGGSYMVQISLEADRDWCSISSCIYGDKSFPTLQIEATDGSTFTEIALQQFKGWQIYPSTCGKHTMTVFLTRH